MIKNYDVAVIGAGLVGCAAAFELAQRGRRVIVFDQDEVNRGASGRNAGSLHFQIEPRMLDVLVSEPQRLAQLIEVNLQAIEDWKRLPALLTRNVEVALHGGLMVAETEAELAVLLQMLELERQSGLSVRIIEGSELRRLAPYLSHRIRWAAYCAEEGHANPRLVTPAYAAAATECGAKLELNAEVRSVEARSGGWRVHARPPARHGVARIAESITIDVETVLVAAGAWSREVLAPLGVD
ncbi:MAG: NAD(P)/FAD-dependent oxidoreductase, partial [Steroidobacteraceae bacterium]